jgi:hypothetical protein
MISPVGPRKAYAEYALETYQKLGCEEEVVGLAWYCADNAHRCTGDEVLGRGSEGGNKGRGTRGIRPGVRHLGTCQAAPVDAHAIRICIAIHRAKLFF